MKKYFYATAVWHSAGVLVRKRQLCSYVTCPILTLHVWDSQHVCVPSLLMQVIHTNRVFNKLCTWTRSVVGCQKLTISRSPDQSRPSPSPVSRGFNGSSSPCWLVKVTRMCYHVPAIRHSAGKMVEEGNDAHVLTCHTLSNVRFWNSPHVCTPSNNWYEIYTAKICMTPHMDSWCRWLSNYITTVKVAGTNPADFT